MIGSTKSRRAVPRPSAPPGPPLDRRIWLRSEWAALTEAQRVAVLARGEVTPLPKETS